MAMSPFSSSTRSRTATATKKIRDPHKGVKDMEKQVEQIVSKTFKSFPPRAK